MDKELEKLLDKLYDKLGNLADIMETDIMKQISKAYKEEAIISMKKYKNGTAETKIEGSTLAILITLAGLEKTILDKLNPPKTLYKLIKESVGIKKYE